MNKEIISKYIYNELFKHKKHHQDIVQLKQSSVFTKLLNEYYHPIHTDVIYDFYQPIYFKHFDINIYQSQYITNSHLNQMKELCFQLNVFKKCEIDLPSNIYNQKTITCSNQKFYYYIFNLFGSYYYPTVTFNGMYPFYISNESNGDSKCFICVEYICMFWKDLYFFSKQNSKLFKQNYVKLIYNTIIPLFVRKSIKKKYYIQITSPFIITMNSSNTDYQYYSKDELRYLTRDYVGYNNPLLELVSIENKKYKNPRNPIYDRCFYSLSQNRRITFDFDLLSYFVPN